MILPTLQIWELRCRAGKASKLSHQSQSWNPGLDFLWLKVILFPLNQTMVHSPPPSPRHPADPDLPGHIPFFMKLTTVLGLFCVTPPSASALWS